MADPFIGQIMLFAGNFAPNNWALCNGQIMSIAQNTALFAILGTTYGGDGITTFGLPNLQSRVAIHPGQGPGLSPYALGQVGGEETHTLQVSEIPMHAHVVTVGTTAADASVSSPGGNILASSSSFAPASAADGSALGGVSCGPAGQSQPHNNIQPYLCLNYIIALVGIFPSRN